MKKLLFLLTISIVFAADQLGRTPEQILEAQENYIACYKYGYISLIDCARKFPEQAALIARIQGHKRLMLDQENLCRAGNSKACDRYKQMLEELNVLQSQVIKPRY